MSSNELVSKIIQRDRKTFFNDYNNAQSHKDDFELLNEDNNYYSDNPLIADFTEYSPLHNGHFHCMKIAKSKVPNGLFVAIVPGLFERSGRGLPYILPREVRAEIAISVGADIVVEGPPMGIMGSGQYSLCLAKMFQALNTDYLPRGYKPVEGFDEIMKRIAIGHGISPKPYKIVDMDTKDVLINGKLEEDNYVIVSFSKSLTKIGFDFKNKFIFVPRIEGVSGTLIRKACFENNLDSVKDMLPKESLTILKREINKGRAPLDNIRDETAILNSANNMSFDELKSLNFFNEKLATEIVNAREIKPFESISEIEDSIFYGFSSHFKHRVLSILETKINSNIISNYIETYPFNIRVLDYKNEHVLEEFRNKIKLKKFIL